MCEAEAYVLDDTFLCILHGDLSGWSVVKLIFNHHGDAYRLSDRAIVIFDDAPELTFCIDTLYRRQHSGVHSCEPYYDALSGYRANV